MFSHTSENRYRKSCIVTRVEEYRLFRSSRGAYIPAIWSPKQSIAFEINMGALKEMPQVRSFATEPFENLDFLVESFNKAASQAVIGVAGYLIYSVLQRHQEAAKTTQQAAAYALHPAPGRGNRKGFAVISIKDGGQLQV
jgi:hypothetical protein